VLTVEVDRPGDFSFYRLRLVKDTLDDDVPNNVDPQLAAVEFSFKVECPSPFDCAPRHLCPAEPEPLPEIDYLAKDYASFRRLMLDRMAALMPAWKEPTSRSWRCPWGSARLQRRLTKLSAGRGRHRSVSRHGAPRIRFAAMRADDIYERGASGAWIFSRGQDAVS
jgi:hypothetical protein